VLVFVGVVTGVHAFSRRPAAQITLHLLKALLTLVVGLYILVFPLSATVTLTFVLAIWFFATGLLELMVAAQQRGLPGAWLVVFSGVIAVLLGIFIAAELPSSAGWAIGLLVGINLVFSGVRLLSFAHLLKRAPYV
jgi:uncharacterized membrane protein HdeD (DUF308 family)